MWTIIKKEALENILTLRFVVGFLACNVLFGITIFVAEGSFAREHSAVRAAEIENDAERGTWETYSQVRPSITKEPSALTPFGSDESGQWGKTFRISLARVPVFADDETSSGAGAGYLEYFYSFDFPSVAQIFVSLLALLFGFDAISGEKRRGALRLILANPVGRAQVFLGKFLGGVVALVPVVLSSFMVSVLIHLALCAVAPGPGQWLALVVMLSVILVYGAVFLALGMLISSFTSSPASSLTGCMAAWVLLVVLLPSLVGFAASEMGFVEDARELERRRQALLEQYDGALFGDIWDFDTYDYTFSRISGGREGSLNVFIAGDNAIAKMMRNLPSVLSSQRRLASSLHALEQEYLQRRLDKIALANNLLRLSPASVLANSISALTSTDVNSHLHFISQARAYRDEVINYIESKGGYSSPRWFTNDHPNTSFRPLIERLETMTEAEQNEYWLDLEDGEAVYGQIMEEIASDPTRRLGLVDMPRFRPRRMPVADALLGAAADFLLLLTCLVAALAATLARFAVYDAR